MKSVSNSNKSLELKQFFILRYAGFLTMLSFIVFMQSAIEINFQELYEYTHHKLYTHSVIVLINS